MKVVLGTLGCKLNQAETELWAKQLAEAGHQLVASTDKADVYILNTCTVTHHADAKSRHLLRMAHRQNPKALVVACGCYAQRLPRELAQMEGVSMVVGNDEKPNLLQRLQTLGYSGDKARMGESLPNGSRPAFRTRAFIKIQDGCHSFCAYCIVPQVRGREQSLSPDQIVAEVKQRVAMGYQEVVLTGTKVGAYNYDGVRLKNLLERLLFETKIARIRLSSLQPQEISTELIGLWLDSRLCPHFHLALQSGSDEVLRRMKRHYNVSDYQGALSLIRALVPQAAITTDVIVGFPGETETNFSQSYGLCQQLAFARIHVFTYSPRPETEAAQMLPKVKAQAIKERSQITLALAEKSAQNFRQPFLGTVRPVLWEKRSRGVWAGLTDNYIKVYARSDEDLTNQLLPVKLVKLFNRDGVWGEVVEGGSKYE